MVAHKTHSARTRRPPSFQCLGIDTTDTLHTIRLIRLIRNGLPFRHLARFQKSTTLSWEKIARFIATPQRTLTRRQSEGRLHPDESDRLLRAATVFDLAARLFEGNLPATLQWLQTPQRALGGELPIEFAATSIGANEVEHLILRLEYGVFS